MNSITRWIAVLAIAFAFGTPAQAQLVSYNPDSPSLSGVTPTFPATATDSHVIVTDLTRASGLVGVSATGGFNSSSWDEGTSFATAMSSSNYYTFTISPAANYSLSFTSISTGMTRSATGATSAQWGMGTSALGSATTTIVTTTGTNPGSTVSAALSDTGVTTSTEFRLAGWTASASGGTLRIESTATLAGSAALRSAGTLIWDGGQGTNWAAYSATAANQSSWNLNNIPTTALVDSLQFAGSTATTTNNNIASLAIGSMAFNSGASAFTINGNALTLNSGVTNNSSNLQTINLGITMGAAQTFNAASGNLSFGSSATIANGGNLLTVDGANDTTIAGGISGMGGLNKNGAGTVVLTGTNMYTGDTNVNDGVLKVDGSTASNTFVNSGGTLAGAGTIFGALTNNGGIVAPGDSPGTLIVNSFTQSSGTLLIDIAGLSMFSVLDVNGLATLGGILNPVLDGYTPNDGDQFAFLLYGSRSGTFSTILGTPFAGGHWEISYSDPTGAGYGPGGGGMAILMAQMNAAPGVPDQGSTLVLLGVSLLGLVICQRQFARKRA